ncbi:hypothetical protein T03_4491 [Trichinella britovi]|uniref:Uncharacterized protein n=1 Tax=Trichinella britovi TaxID=45882 RepID=A0A0V1CSS9_TRIBR|nr:hypothetical protein T03_4491 [Trichinella britovi]
MSCIPLVAKQKNCVLATVRLNKAQNTGHAIDSPREIELAAKLEATTTPKSSCKRLKSPPFLISYSQYWVSARTSIAHSSFIVLQGKFSNYENELQIEEWNSHSCMKRYIQSPTHVYIALLRGELSSKLWTLASESSSTLTLLDLTCHSPTPSSHNTQINIVRMFSSSYRIVSEVQIHAELVRPRRVCGSVMGFVFEFSTSFYKSVVVTGPWHEISFKIFYFAAVINDQLIVVDQENSKWNWVLHIDQLVSINHSITPINE